MNIVSPSFGAAVVISVICIIFYVLYRAALPKPLEGIPYNKDAAEKVFGDVPEMMGYVVRTKRIFVGSCCLLLEDSVIQQLTH